MNIKHDGDLPCSNGFNVKVVSSNVEHFQSIISRLWSQRHPKAKGIQVLPCGEKKLDLWRTGGVPDCTLSSSNLEMNQEHLEICAGTVHVRRGLDMETWRGLLEPL